METDKRETARRVSEYLRQHREVAGLSKKKAAELSGMSEGRWRQLEKGTEMKGGIEHPATTSAKTLVKIARALSREPSELLSIAGFKPDVEHAIDPDCEVEKIVKPDEMTDDYLGFPALTVHERYLTRAFIDGLIANRPRT